MLNNLVSVFKKTVVNKTEQMRKDIYKTINSDEINY
jgi:hypothetical protein